MYPLNHRLLSSTYVQPIVDKHIALTYQYLEARANEYNGLNISLRDFIVPLTFNTAGYAFFGEDCPVDDLLKPFRLFDDNFHLLLVGVPRMFMKGPMNALDELAMVIEEKYLWDPSALDDTFCAIKEYERVAKGCGFVS